MTQPPLPVPDIEAQAADWFARLQGEPDLADWQMFQAWLEAAPAHAAAYAVVEDLWVDLESPAVAPAPDRSNIIPLRPRRVQPAIWLAAATAAAAVLAVVALPSALSPRYVSYTTGKAETRRVELADGSHLVLGGATRLRVRLTRGARDVELAEGEASFDVSHEPARPFVVALGPRRVTVLGTEFNIRRQGADATVTVRRGAVALSEPGTGRRVTVGKDQQVDTAQGPRLSVHATDADAAFAWTAGQLVYDHEPIAQVVADLNRYGAKLVRLDPSARAIRVTGVLRIDDQAAMIRRLELFSPLEGKVVGGDIVLVAKPTLP